MIIWGGTDDPFGGQVANSNPNRYSPNQNRWITGSDVGAPIGRQHGTAIWTGTEMIVWGGSGNSGLTATGGRYCAN
jgi:hypothetical protein